jgi:hypothetical protein
LIPLWLNNQNGFECESTIGQLLNSNPPLPVYTHQRVDADAAFSVAAWAYLTDRRIKELDLHFVSSEDQIPPNVVALDVLKGIKGSNSCCFAKLLPFFGEKKNYHLEALGTYLTKVDNHQKYEEGLPPGVFYLLPAHILVGLKMRGVPDRELCEWAELTLIALIAQGERMEQSYNSDLPPGSEKFLSGRVVLLPPGSPQYATSIAFRQGAEVVVYQDGFNTGIIRETSSKFPLDVVFRSLPDGFYLDPRGFLLAWGSKKFPKSNPSPVSARELALRVVAELQKKNERWAR